MATSGISIENKRIAAERSLTFANARRCCGRDDNSVHQQAAYLMHISANFRLYRALYIVLYVHVRKLSYQRENNGGEDKPRSVK